MSAVKEMALTQVQPTQIQTVDPMLAMIERFVSDPSVDVDKLERLVQMNERAIAKAAENAFNESMSAAQELMRPIAADATNPQTKSKYASYAQLDRALRPIYTAHGFALSFNTADCPLADHVRVLCDVTKGAHCKPYRLDMPADGKGAKGGDVMTKTHAAGSAVTYGMRYLLKMIFNVAVGEDDDDGNKAGKPEREIVAPQGFENWLADLETLVTDGCDWPALQKAWNDSKEEYRAHISKTNRSKVEGWRNAAKAVSAKAVKRG